MKDLRDLLIDCRIELRKLSRDFQKTELCDRLDLAIQSVAAGTLAAPAEAPPADTAPQPASEKGQTVSQVALARIDWLTTELAKGPSASGAVRKVVPDPQDTVPTAERIAAVAAGAGGFTKEQREWSIGEAMVLSGFQFTPVELIAKGDRAIAQMIVDARKGDAA